MKLPETPQACLFEKNNWESIVNSQNWIIYRKFLIEHIAFLQNEVNAFVRDQKMVEAYGSLRAMDDNRKFLDLITKRITALNEKIEKGA